MRRNWIFTFMVLVVVLLSSACSGQTLTPAVQPVNQAPPPDQAQPVEADQEPATENNVVVADTNGRTLWVQPGVPSQLAENVRTTLTNNAFTEVGSPETASVRVVLQPGPEAQLTSQWVYAVAAPFATLPDDVSWGAVQSYWATGDASGLVGPYGFESTPPLVLTQSEADLLTNIIGPPAQGIVIQVPSGDALSETLWSNRPAFTIMPFDQLQPDLKVLDVDTVSVLDKQMDASTYPLSVAVGIAATGEGGAQALQLLQAEGWQATNRDPQKITKVVTTGTVAVARAVAMEVELNGSAFPSRDILPFFSDADIVHTSNESSYAVDCPEPDWYGDPIFCSKRAYFDVLALAGIDVVEATGNHVNDYGIAAMENTLNVYDNEGIVYFGGGRNIDDALAPRIITTENGTRVAFIGCNSVGPNGAFATTETPGAAPCGDWTRFMDTITNLKANDEADVVIAALQYWELPLYEASAEQISDFAAVAEAGADVVSGSQAHQPQGFGFPNGEFAHYGVGNLFFDQPDIENRQMFADKHVIYDGEHISTELFTGLIEDWSRPRPMDADDRREFLALIFDASNW